jgi:hypothetical protein
LGQLACRVKVAALAMVLGAEPLVADSPVFRRRAKCDQPRLASWRWGRGTFGLAFAVCLDWF